MIPMAKSYLQYIPVGNTCIARNFSIIFSKMRLTKTKWMSASFLQKTTKGLSKLHATIASLIALMDTTI
jgi:hypothetical protein